MRRPRVTKTMQTQRPIRGLSKVDYGWEDSTKEKKRKDK